jgi:type I restriction enzyme S subunit
MFGDPVSNEKGWEKDAIGNVAPVKAYKGKVKSIEGKYWLLNLDMVESKSGDILAVNIVTKSEIGNSTVAFNEENVLYSKLRPYLNKVVNPSISGYSTSELLPLLPKKGLLDKTFLVLLLRSKFFVNYIQEKVAGAKMPRVSMDVFRAFQIILPPLALQTQFSKRIESIEEQKSLITKSIADVQHLFDYTMDRYFN